MFDDITKTLFLGLLIFLVGFLYCCFKRSIKRPMVSVCIVAIWLLITGILSVKGFFMRFDVLPPRILFAIVPMVLVLIYTAISSKVLPLLTHIPQTWLIYVQAFRIVMEMVLWLLAKEKLVPEIMTWDGHNFDILIGITAPMVAYLCFTINKWSPKIALVWNWLGILFLLNVFVHGLLSAPTPFQVFVTNPPNTFVGYFPYTWLPAFVVPCAILFHILSIRKIVNSAGLYTQKLLPKN